MKPHAVIVLAAGGSRRLGRPKQLLRRDGETLVHRMTRLALDTAPDRLLVVCGGYAEEVGTAMQDLPVELLINTHWQDGLGGSLRVAASALARHLGPTLILSCDQPALTTKHLQKLVDLAQDTPSGCAATAHGERIGIPVVVSASVLRTAHSLRGDHGLGEVLNAFPRDGLAMMTAPELQDDLDTEDDVAAAVAKGWLDPVAADGNTA
ncbi:MULTISPECIES: nucleotidyltransferase family protein [unclassified Pseudoxanthomonas]|uniref:nucleotidyltransferase family protein n=1 Tax=unclassified Pseudoxanthomonas TaxID=2645906 RepID=UPI003077C02E